MKNIYNKNFLTIDASYNNKDTKYCYNEEITVIKNNSISKYGIKNNKIYNLNNKENLKQIKAKNNDVISLRKKMFPNNFNDYGNENESIQEKKYKIKLSKQVEFRGSDKESERLLDIRDKKDYDDSIRGKEIYTKEVIVSGNDNVEKTIYLNKINNFGNNIYPEKSQDKILNSIFTEIVKVKGNGKDDNVFEENEIEEQEREYNYRKNCKNSEIKPKAKEKKPINGKCKNLNANSIKGHNTFKKNEKIEKRQKSYYNLKNAKNGEKEENNDFLKKGTYENRIYNRRFDLYNQYLKEKNKENNKNNENEENMIPIKNKKYRRELNKNKITNEIIYRKKNKYIRKKNNNMNENDNESDNESEQNYSQNIYNQENRISSRNYNIKRIIKDIENERKQNKDLLNIKKEKPVNVKQNFNFEIKININEDKLREKKWYVIVEKEIITKDQYNTQRYSHTKEYSDMKRLYDNDDKDINVQIKKFEVRDYAYSNVDSEQKEEDNEKNFIKTRGKNLNVNKSEQIYRFKRMYNLDDNKENKIIYRNNRKPEKGLVKRTRYITYNRNYYEDYDKENGENRLIKRNSYDKNSYSSKRSENNIVKYNNKDNKNIIGQKNIYQIYEKKLMDSNDKNKIKIIVNRINYTRNINDINKTDNKKVRIRMKKDRDIERDKLRLELKRQYENERLEKERKERENTKREKRETEILEKERLQKERREKETKDREKSDRKERKEREKKERERMERLEKKRTEKEERIKKEKSEKERLEILEREIKEKLERELQEKLEKERQEIIMKNKKEKLERQIKEREKERIEQERLERERIENEKKEILERKRKEKKNY